ncbi:M9 family metallopeptidase [Photobacterium sanguinicancri]|uniref:M9 family metallopeptidase n=1 Tax=Photobacterium sanguinicancri TaxID=875932 RepID=UPI0026E1347A|nr:M9 family metallopeptidase [Photobacterium sanguinicancri]MDO6496546.1 collagenase [Photobacterium sanguinicancri]
MTNLNTFKHSALAILLSSCFYTSQASAAPTCEINALSTSQNPLIAVASADLDCRNEWFSASVTHAQTVFSDHLVEQAQVRLLNEVNSYRGEPDQAVIINNLGEFIRAAYYVRSNNKQQLGEFSDALDLKLAQTINAFITSPYAINYGYEQSSALKSMTIMVDNIRRLPLTMANQLALLNHFTPESAEHTRFIESMNDLFRAMSGHTGNDDFYSDLVKHPEYLQQLEQFIYDNEWALETDASFIVSNASREMGRLLASPHKETKQQILAIQKNLLERYPLGGKSDKIWVGIAEMVNHFAPDQAESMGLKDGKAQLEALVMPFNYPCDGPAIVRAQKMDQAQALEVCATLNEKEADFHQIVNSNGVPVADDHNDNVEVIVFDSNSDYVTYSNFLFGNTTDNGGQYLEGNPANPDNKARFIAYRNEYADGFSILNLEHEYVHYLDGRFNLYGDFGDVLREGNTVWWLEGFAEYMHYKEGYNAAIELGKTHAYSLPEVMATTYSHDTNRVYRWGYLAVRFLMDNHPEEVDQLLTLGRNNNFKAWAKKSQDIGLQYDQEFSLWLDTLQTTSQPTPGGKEPIVTALSLNSTVRLEGEKYSEQQFYIDVPEFTRSLELSIQGEGDADLYASFDRVAHYYDHDFTSFSHGSNEQVTIEPQANGYIKAGRYYISIDGREAFNNVELLAKAEVENQGGNQGGGQGSSAERDDLAPVVLATDDPINLDIINTRYLALYVPEGKDTVRIWVTPKAEQNNTNVGTQSNVDLYAAQAHWPTPEKHDASSHYTGNQEFIELKTNQNGYVHFMLSNNGNKAEVEVYATAY